MHPGRATTWRPGVALHAWIQEFAKSESSVASRPERASAGVKPSCFVWKLPDANGWTKIFSSELGEPSLRNRQ